MECVCLHSPTHGELHVILTLGAKSLENCLKWSSQPQLDSVWDGLPGPKGLRSQLHRMRQLQSIER